MLPYDFGEEVRGRFDVAVERVCVNRRTFTEEQILRSAWDEGYHIQLTLDSRFELATEACATQEPHWRLQDHILANDRLLERLWNRDWDGRNLDIELEKLDAETSAHHVFCPVDVRFEQTAEGLWRPTIRETDIEVPADVRAALDSLAPALVEEWQRSAPEEPWTFTGIIQALSNLGWEGAHRRDGWLHVRSWLATRSEIARANTDHWVLCGLWPTPPHPERLRVRPLYSQTSRPEGELHQAANIEIPSGGEDPSYRHTVELIPTDLQSEVVGSSWVTTLRTFNLVGGYLTVPPQARSAYPAAYPGATAEVLILAKWCETGDNLRVWLDKTTHRLYGPDLESQLGWCDTGRKLRVKWLPDALLFILEGIDLDIHREESRLVDLDEIGHLRGGLSESYYKSIEQALKAAENGLPFRELVEAVRARQQHNVSGRTIRALMSAAGFICQDNRWVEHRDPRSARRSIRRATIAAYATHDRVASGDSLVETAATTSLRLTEILDELKHIEEADQI